MLGIIKQDSLLQKIQRVTYSGVLLIDVYCKVKPVFLFYQILMCTRYTRHLPSKF